MSSTFIAGTQPHVGGTVYMEQRCNAFTLPTSYTVRRLVPFGSTDNADNKKGCKFILLVLSFSERILSVVVGCGQ